MDLLKLIRSFEEFLFELLSWIIYYPLTLWRVVRHPLQMMRYSDHEQRESDDEQYADTLSPPLFLLATLALLHAVAIEFGMPAIPSNTAAGQALNASAQNFVIAQAFLFGLLPLFAAWRYVTAKGLPLERKNVRPVFFGQCYIAATYAMAISLSMRIPDLGMADAHIIMQLALLAVTVWYLVVQTWQFRISLDCSVAKAAFLASRAYIEGALAFVVITVILLGIPD